MAKIYRMKCSTCGNVQNVNTSKPCKKCGAQLNVEQPASITLYRMGNVLACGAGFGIYINEQPYGAIGNRENLVIPLPYGEYKMHIVCGMSRKCNDPIINLSPEDSDVCMKVHMKPGIISNKFIIDRVDPSTMPKD